MTKFSFFLFMALLPFSFVSNAIAEDSVVSDDIYGKPLTYRDLPIGYRETPYNTTTEPRGFMENPRNWTTTPGGFREKAWGELDEVRNGRENPVNFTEKDAILVSNLDESLKTKRDEHDAANLSESLRIEVKGAESSQIKDDIIERDPGYGGANPPSKVKLPDFQ